MIPGIFITGTDTGVGKTYIAAGVAAELKRRGADIGVMKPVETGCRKRAGRLIPGDALRLMKAAGVRDPRSLVNPYRFSRPLAPLVAAEFEGKRIDPKIIAEAYKQLSLKHACMLVEGAGGIMVPLSGDYLNLDLAEALGLGVLVVARPSLGTINHTLLTISALKARRLNIIGIVINYARDRREGHAERTSPRVIEALSKNRILSVVRHGSHVFDSIVDYIVGYCGPDAISSRR